MDEIIHVNSYMRPYYILKQRLPALLQHLEPLDPTNFRNPGIIQNHFQAPTP